MGRIEEEKGRARESADKLKTEIEVKGRIGWKRVMEVAGNEIAYKLTLKYLREGGYDIGNYKRPFVKKK